jgi:protease-4
MDKLGVDRRLYTAGENKAFLDPYSPEKEQDVEVWQDVLETTHRQFIESVREGRGDRLADNEQMFSGLVWSGEQALELGLIDGLGSTSHVARQIVGQEELVDYRKRKSPFQDIMDQFGVSIGSGIADYLMESRLQLR